MKKTTTNGKNTRTPAEIFAFLHSVEGKKTAEWYSPRLAEKDNVTIIVDCKGMPVGEVWVYAMDRIMVAYCPKTNNNHSRHKESIIMRKHTTNHHNDTYSINNCRNTTKRRHIE